MTGITANGGDPTGSDTLIVNAQPGVANPMVVEPTTRGAGTVVYVNNDLSPVDFSGIEQLELVGQRADGDPCGVDGTIGDDQFEVLPGPAPDSGTIFGTMDQNNASGVGPFPLVPVSFGGMAQTNVLVYNVFAQVGGADSFIYDATAGNDSIGVGRVGAGDISISIGGLLYSNVLAHDLASAHIRGFDGDDSFVHDVTVDLPLSYEGGNPDDGSDVLHLLGSPSARTVTVAPHPIESTQQQITSPAATVIASGMELIHYDGQGNLDTLVVNVGDGASSARVQGAGGRAIW